MTSSIPFGTTTEEYWDVDGVSLHKYGWNVQTFGGERYDLPSRRGRNTTFAYRPGTMHRGKVPESKVINLLMWMVGANPDTGIPSADQTLQFNDNWEVLRKLFWRPNGTQMALTRRWRLSSALARGESVLEATALAELTNTMTPRMTGRTRAEFAVELLLADPFFYGKPEAAELFIDTPTVVFNRGDDVAAHNHMSLDIIGGPISNPTLTNYSSSPAVSVTYNGIVEANTRLRLNISQFQAALWPANTNEIGKISHAGSRNWFGLLPGDNYITLSGAGIGQAELRWSAPYV